MNEEKNITDLSVKTLAERIRKRELTCVEVATAFLDVIEQKKHLNANIYVNRERALDEAALMDKEADAGSFRGDFHGVPISIKDNIHIKGIPNTAGSPALRDFVPSEDAACITLLRQAGFLFIAKNNMHEMAFGMTSDNKEFGRVGNVHDPEYSAGGSSGGTGAAVASHMSPAGIGTDTGGSVRIPASFNGVCGFKPTLGRYPNSSVTPISRVRETIGPLAHTVEDLILIDEVLSGQKFEPIQASLRGVRLGVSSDLLCAGLDPEVEAAFQRTKQILLGAGVELIEVDFRPVMSLHDECASVTLFYGAKTDVASYLKEYNIPMTLQELTSKLASPDVKEIYESQILSDKFTHEEYEKALKVVRPELIKAYHNLFEKYRIDALICPTIPYLPVKFSNVKGLDTVFQYIRNVSPASVSGMPSISLPMQRAADRLPIGLLIDGLENQDQLILSLAKSVQELLKGELDLISF